MRGEYPVRAAPNAQQRSRVRVQQAEHLAHILAHHSAQPPRKLGYVAQQIPVSIALYH